MAKTNKPKTKTINQSRKEATLFKESGGKSKPRQ
jgi:hypothetical protein